ncbi:MAG: HAD family phosphatase [Candidatus Nomurabacteria bacterium]|jgi:epoxide hydrolase-like predicted phosphatase|nr:HAD family phosphatase [Candidatus Nomurabacteria bacterium]
MANDNKVIFFDFYGVIWYDGLLKYLRDHGLTFSGEIRTSDRARCAGKITKQQHLDNLAKATGHSGDYIYNYMISINRPDDKVVEILAKLKNQGYKLALLTNCSESILGRIKNGQLRQYFDDMILSYKVGVTKPDLRIYELALQKLGISADEAIFIDDKSENTDAAEKLGIKSILFTSAADLVVKLSKLGVKI